MGDLVAGSMKSVTGRVSKMAKLIGKNALVLLNMLEAKERMSAVTVSMKFLGHSTWCIGKHVVHDCCGFIEEIVG